MAEIQGGVPVTGFVSPTDTADTFPTHKDVYGQGGYRSVANIAERDAITADRRSEGMIVFLNDTKVAYQLIGGIEDANWQVTNDLVLGSLQENYVIMGNPDNEPQASPALLDAQEDIGIIYDRLDALDGGTSGGGTTNGTRNLSGFVVGEVEPDGSMNTYRGPDCFLSEIPTGGDVHFFNDRLTGLGDPYSGEIGEQDAVNRRTLDNKTWTSKQITDFGPAVRSVPINEMALPTADMDFNAKLLNNVATPLSTTPNAAATVEYVEDAIAAAAGAGTITLTGAVTGTGTGTINTTLTPITSSQISDFNSAVVANSLDSFAAPTSNISFNNNRLTQLSDPVDPTDGVNLRTLGDAIDAATSSPITLTGAVTGTSDANGNIATVLTPITVSQISNYTTSTQSLINATPISGLAAATADINLGTFRISSSAVPTTGNHLGNKTYIDNTSSSAATTAVNNRTTTLTGAVTGTGTGNTINTVLTNITPSQVTGFDAQVRTSRLDQMALPTANMDFNGKLLNNVATPLSTNTNAAATVGYVTSAIASGGSTTTLTGAVTGSGIGTIATTLTPITTSQITNYTSATQALINATPISSLASATANINLGTFSISSGATPTTDVNLVNKSYVDATYGALKEQASLVVDNNTFSQSFAANTTTKLLLSLNGFAASSTVFSFNYTNSRFICTLPPTTTGIGVNSEVTINFTSSNIVAHNLTAQIALNGALGSYRPPQTIRCTGNNASDQIYIVLPQSYGMATNDYLEIYLTFTVATTLVVRNLVWNIRGR